MADNKATVQDVTDAKADKAGQGNKQVQGTVPYAVWDALESYAFGTRRKLAQVIAQAVIEFHDNHADEIKSKRVD